MYDTSLLSKCKLFYGINENELSSVLNCLGVTERKYEKGSLPLCAGSAAASIGLLLSGKLKIVREDMAGNTSLMAEVMPGELFGEGFICAGIKISPVTVEAAEACSILWLQFQKIITTCSSSCLHHTRLIENMLKIIAQKNLYLNHKIDILSKRTLREKLLRYFNGFVMEQKSQTILLPLSRNELADYICADRSAVSRELSKMKQEGLIEINKNYITLLNC